MLVPLRRTVVSNGLIGETQKMISGWLPQNVSTFGGDIDWMFRLILYVVGFWFVLVEGVFLYFVLRYRRKPGQRAFFNRGDSRRELAWVLVPALVILGLDLGIDVAGSAVWDKVKGTPPPAALQIHVTAKQFNWEFTYPDAEGKFGSGELTQENELHVPVGQVIGLTLESTDVIHSFFVPNLRLKQDVVPGRKIAAWFEATKPGTYPIACTELCGFGHYTMAGTLIVESEQDYQRWRREQAPASASADSGAASKTN
jgi:cytochrome c oxidase subunit II